jgi:hypothetical protein
MTTPTPEALALVDHIHLAHCHCGNLVDDPLCVERRRIIALALALALDLDAYAAEREQATWEAAARIASEHNPGATHSHTHCCGVDDDCSEVIAAAILQRAGRDEWGREA